MASPDPESSLPPSWIGASLRTVPVCSASVRSQVQIAVFQILIVWLFVLGIKLVFGFFLTCGGRMNLIIYALVRLLKELCRMQMMLVTKLFVELSQSLLQCDMRMVSPLRQSMMIHYQVRV